MYLEAFLTFLRIGLFTIGGGYVMIPMIEDEVVRRHRWIDSRDFADLLALAQSVPGIFAVNMAVFIGYRLRRLKGALSMAAGVVLPSFVIILLIALFFQRFRSHPLVEHIFLGVRPAAVALLTVAVFTGCRHIRFRWSTCWVPVVAALLPWLMGVSPIFVVVGAGLGGWLHEVAVRCRHVP
ncbi:MAG: chromate transporter [Bacteroidales bacterium]|nr:chromate transporter [Bacteroidales bacterium]